MMIELTWNHEPNKWIYVLPYAELTMRKYVLNY